MNMSDKKYDEQVVRDHILVLIERCKVPVRGKTLFMHMMFMVFKWVSPELEIPFFPYQFGPYSNPVANECNWLADKDFITVTKKGRSWNFELTDKGRDRVGSITISERKMEKIAKIKKDTHNCGLSSTIELGKEKYPEYFIYARV